MTHDHSFRKSLLPVAAATALLCLVLGPAVAPARAEVPVAGKEIEEKLEYSDLARYVGKTVRVRTTFKTVRTGTLLKYTDAALTVKLPDREGGMELSMPRSTVVEVSSPYRMDEPFYAEPGADGAKKE